MTRNWFKRLCWLALVILTACSSWTKTPQDEAWVNPNAYLAPQRVFTLAGLPAYVDEKEVFRIHSDMEAALMSAIQYDQGRLSYHYVTDQALSLDRIFAYLESLLPFSFKLSMGELTYSKQDAVVMTLYSLEIQPVFDDAKALNGLVDAFKSQYLSATSTTLETIRAIHDQLVLKTAYDTSILNLDLTQIQSHPSFEAYGLLSQGKAVCSGYARAFNALAKAAAIPSIMVSSESMQHAWNLVYDGTGWRYLDATFDDPIPDLKNKVRYTYFMLDKAAFLADGKHRFDLSGPTRLDDQDYIDFANYVFFNPS